MKYTLSGYEDEVFNKQYEDNDEEYLRNKRDKDTRKYRIKTIVSGSLLECEINPIWNSNKKSIRDKIKQDKELQLKMRHKNIQRNLVRLVNGNFGRNDIWITIGYRGEEQPESRQGVKRDVENYIKRLRRYVTKMGWPKLKYIYVIEGNGTTQRFHVHMVMNFTDRDVAEHKWGRGKYSQARRLQPDDYGLTGLAKYITKQAVKDDDDNSKTKAYCYSLGLYKSWEHAKISHKMTKTKASEIAREEMNVKEYFEDMYPDFTFKDMKVNTSDHVTGWYIYTRMRKRE